MDSTVRATERREGKTSPVVTVKHVRQPARRVCLSLVRLAADVRFPNKVVNYCFKLLLFISFGGNTQRSTGKLCHKSASKTLALLRRFPIVAQVACAWIVVVLYLHISVLIINSPLY